MRVFMRSLIWVICVLNIDVGAQQATAGWGAEQATGEPNTPRAGDHQTAWASLTPDGQDEWLLVTYAKEVVPAKILIHETYNPGAVFRVTAFDAQDEEIDLWKGVDPIAIGQAKGVAEIVPTVAVKTRHIKIYLASKRVSGWNEIDAVGVLDQDEKLHWATEAEASSSYARRVVSVKGQVLDAQGKPFAGAVVSSDWRILKGKIVSDTHKKTDQDGQFDVTAVWRGRALPVMAFDNSGALVGMTAFTQESLYKPGQITMQPAIRLAGKVSASDQLETGLPQLSLGLHHVESGAWLMRTPLNDTHFSFNLPEGQYILQLNGMDFQALEKQVTLTQEQPQVDLGTFVIEPTLLSTLNGKTFPDWTVTEAKGVSPNVLPKDFRGKWLVIEFWGYW